MKAVATTVHACLNEIASFSLESSSPSETRDDIVNRLNAAVEALFPHFGPWLPFLAYRRGDIQDSLHKLQSAITEAQTELATAKSFVETKKTEVDGIISATKMAAAEVGVQSFTQDFDGQSTKAKEDSIKWLSASIILAIMTIISAFVFIKYLMPDANASLSLIIQITITKVVTLSVLFTATLWCSNIYKALKHQQSINSHRAHSLKTFQAFVESTNDVTVRDAILLEAAHSIFTMGATGFIDPAAESKNNSSKIVEIMKSSTSSLTSE